VLTAPDENPSSGPDSSCESTLAIKTLPEKLRAAPLSFLSLWSFFFFFFFFSFASSSSSSLPF